MKLYMKGSKSRTYLARPTCTSHIGTGTGGAGGAVAPKKLLGEQLVHPAPPFFLQLTVKHNLTDSKVTFDTKILEN